MSDLSLSRYQGISQFGSGYETVLRNDTHAPGGGWTAGRTQDEARARWLHGQWLAREAARYNLPVMEPRPWETLVGRVIDHLA